MNKSPLFMFVSCLLLILGSIMSPLAQAQVVPSETSILMVVGANNPASASDEAIRQRLVSQGFQVTLVLDGVVQTTHADGKSLVLISSSSRSTRVVDRLKLIPVPVICWEPYLYDDMGMTGTVENTDYAWLADQSTINVNGTSSSIAVGTFGQQIVYTSPNVMCYGLPYTVSSGAHIVATINGSATPCIFTYRTGRNMVGMKAPAPRVALFFGDQAGVALTDQGWKYFDASVNWALTIDAPPNQPPTAAITAPVNGATYLAPATIQITADAADPDGSIAKVEFYNGAALLGTATTSPYSLTMSDVQAGVYNLLARAVDNKGAEGLSASVSVTVNVPNKAPLISISSPSTGSSLVAPASVILNATASDPDGAVTKVEFYKSSTLLGTDTTSPYSYTASNLPAGTHTFTGVVYDDTGASTTSAPLTVTVAANKPPTVSLSSTPSSATAPASFALAATAADSDGTISKVDFFNGTTLLGTDTTSPYTFTWSNVAAGTYTLTAKARDNSGAVTTSAAVTVTSVAPNQPPTVSITAPANGATFTAPAAYTITASASDSDGTIAKVEFYRGTTLLSSDTTAPYSVSRSGVAAGTYTYTAVAHDNSGSTVTSAPITVTVNAPANVAPTVSISNPANGASFTAPANVTMDASAADSDGSIAKVEFYRGTTLVGTDASSPYSVSISSLAAGSYSLTARAYDNAGAQTTSAAVNITVTAPNAAPTVSITSPANGASFIAPASLTLSATAVDTDGSIAKVEFYRGTTLIGTDTSSPYSASQSSLAAGSYSFTAKAYDNSGAVTTSATVSISVTAPTTTNVLPTVSMTSPVNNSNLAAPASFTLAASASDSDGSIAKVEFYRGTTLLGTDTSSPYSLAQSQVAAGTYYYSAKAYDNSGGMSQSSSVKVTVYASTSNPPPTVAFTYPTNNATFPSPGKLTLLVSATDNKKVAKVEFYKGSTLVKTDSYAPYDLYRSSLAIGSYTYTAKAFDDQGATSSAIVKFTVYDSNTPPVVSITSPAAGSTHIAPANVTIAAQASDPGGQVNKVEFYKGSTLIKTIWTAPYQITQTKLLPGSYSYTAKAIDNKGKSASSTVSFKVKLPNAIPDVTLVAPKGSTVTAPATVALTAFASDSDGSLTRVEFYKGTTLLASDAAAPYQYTVSGLAAGTHKFTAKAYDNEGTVTESFPLTIVCNSATSSAIGQSIIATNGVAKAVIITETTGTNVAKAANALKDMVLKTSGVSLSILPPKSATPSGMVGIRIGEGAMAKAESMTVWSLQYGQFRIKTVGSNILIVGRDTDKFSGNVWAVEYLMDRFMGVRWLWPGASGTVIPKLTSIAIPAMDFKSVTMGEQKNLATRFGSLQTTVEPKALLTMTEQNKVEAEANAWLDHHRIGSTKSVITSHDFADWWSKYRLSNPEYFAHPPTGAKNPYHGNPEWTKLCTSNAGVITRIVSLYKAAGSPDYWSAGPTDAAGHCTCVDCLAMDEVTGTRNKQAVWEGDESLTIRYVKWWARILTALRQVNPNVKLGIIAYGTMRTPPPAHYLPNSNYLLTNVAATSPAAFTHWVTWGSAGAQQALRPNWWHCATHAPYLIHREEGEFTKHAIANGMWNYRQDELKGSFGAQGLRYYTFARLTVRPELTIDQIVDEYVSGFGAAQLQIREYIAYWESFSRRAAYPWIQGGATMRPGYSLYNYHVAVNGVSESPLGGSFKALYLIYTDPVLAPAFAILDRADAAALNETAIVKARLKFLRDGLLHVQQTGRTIKLGYELKKDSSLESAFLTEYQKLRTLRRDLTFRHVTWGDNDFKSEKQRGAPSFPQ